MGIAILCVLLYHSYCWVSIPDWVGNIFRPLFIGVDVFMCASGFGLCYALRKRDTISFYRRRLLRIYPSYAIMAFFVTLLCVLNGSHFNLWDIFCQFSTLQYYCLGGHRFDWYLSALLVLYILFPFFFKYRHPLMSVAFQTLALVTLFLIPMDWAYNAGIARLGIFLYGILMFRTCEENVPVNRLIFSGVFFTLIAIISVILSVSSSSYTAMKFLMTASLTPLILFTIYFCHQKLHRFCAFQKLSVLISFFGKYSLLLYTANVIVQFSLTYAKWHSIMAYVLLQIAWSLLLFLLDHVLIQPLMNRPAHT